MQLLKACDGEMSRAELMHAVGMKDRVSFSKIYLDAAIADDLIEMSQPNAPKSPTQKYRLTKKGRNIMESQK
jgi:ATP-dependent DNA helicase RecG